MSTADRRHFLGKTARDVPVTESGRPVREQLTVRNVIETYARRLTEAYPDLAADIIEERDEILAALAATGAREDDSNDGVRPALDLRWYLGSMNDGLVIIDKPPSPSGTDIPPGVYASSPDMILNVAALTEQRARAIIDAHNASLSTGAPARDEPGIDQRLGMAADHLLHDHDCDHDYWENFQAAWEAAGRPRYADLRRRIEGRSTSTEDAG